MNVVTYTLTVTLGENDDPEANGPIVLDMLYAAQSRVHSILMGLGASAVTEDRPRIHKAAPQPGTEEHGASLCTHCSEPIKRVPGGQGSTWVHTDSGAVAGSGAPR